MTKLWTAIKSFVATLYSYVSEPAELAGLAMFVAITVFTAQGLITGWQIVVAYGVAVAVYIGLRPSSISTDGAEFEDGGDDE